MDGWRSDLGALPLPVWGEGWGEGVTELSRDLNPSPHPSPSGRGSRSSLPPTISTLRPDDMLSALAAVLVAFLADALDRDHPLALRGIEHDHTLGRAPGDADAFDARADELAAVGHQHELVPVLDRERGDQLAGFLPDRAVALAHIHGDNAFSAAAGDAVFVGRRALAVAALGDREHELLGRRHFHIALLAELDGAARLFGVRRALLRLPVDAAADRTRTLEIRRALVGARLHVPQDRKRNHLVALGERDTANAVRRASLEHAHVGDRETNALAPAYREKDVVVFRANLHVDDRVPLVELHGDDPRRSNFHEVGELVAPHVAARGGKHHVELTPSVLVLGQRHERGDGLALFERQDVDQRLAARLRRRLRQPPHFLLVDTAVRREEQHRRVGRGHEQPRDEILLARLHPRPPLPTAPLRAIGRQRHALDVAEMGDRHHHVLAVDEVFFLHLAFLLEDDRAAGSGKLLPHRLQLVLDDGLDARTRAQNVEVVRDLLGELVELGLDLVAAERGETLETQVEDGFGLFGRELVGAARRHLVARIVD